MKYFSEVNSRASAQKKDAQSHKTTKRYIPVEKKSDAKKPVRQIPTGQRFSPTKSSAVYVKITPHRYGLAWKPTDIIFTYVGLRWILTRKTIETCLNTNDSALPLGKETCTPNIVICANSSSLSAGTAMAFEPISSKGSTNFTSIAHLYLLLFYLEWESGFRNSLIMEYLVKISKKACILELKRRHLKILTLTSYTPYPSRKIRRICACTSQKTTNE
ncbi:hypothetical protein Tco_0122230 [Tanacetum coccineum]